MAKFCTRCGSKLEEGQVCSCMQTVNVQPAPTVNPQPVPTVNVQTNPQGFDFNKLVSSYVDIVKGIFTHPADTIKKYATSNNFILGLVAILLNCIVSGVFLYCLCNEAFSLLGLFTGGYSSLLSLGSSIDVPFMKIFLYGVLFMAVWFIAAALMIYVMAGAIFKDKLDVKKAFALVGVSSIFTTLTTILAIICVYININVMTIVLVVALLFYLTHLYQGIIEATELNKNKLVYVFVPAIVVASFFMMYVLPKILF